MSHDEHRSVHLKVNPKRACSILPSQQRLFTINTTAQNEMSLVILDTAPQGQGQLTKEARPKSHKRITDRQPKGGGGQLAKRTHQAEQ